MTFVFKKENTRKRKYGAQWDVFSAVIEDCVWDLFVYIFGFLRGIIMSFGTSDGFGNNKKQQKLSIQINVGFYGNS